MTQTTLLKNDIQDAIKQLYLALKVTASYPKDHPNSLQLINKSYKIFSAFIRKQESLSLVVISNTLLVNDKPIDSDNDFSRRFVHVLSKRDIESIIFFHGLSFLEYKTFLTLMAGRPDEIKKAGGMAKSIMRSGISQIKINEVTYGTISNENKV